MAIKIGQACQTPDGPGVVKEKGYFGNGVADYRLGEARQLSGESHTGLLQGRCLVLLQARSHGIRNRSSP